MAKWVATKKLDLDKLNEKINGCFKTNHFTNNGINVIETQNKIKKLFKINENKEVLLVCNGAMGLNALVGAYNMLYDKKLRWAVQAFTFPCSVQGNLENSLIIDIDENMGPNISTLMEKKDEYDGIVITNCFGCSSNIQLYETFCKNNNKILLFDNAASPITYYNAENHLNYGDGSIISLHHTKPIGFGEGGFIVFNKNMIEYTERTICFGFTKENRNNFNVYANNYKMSEVACIYISEYLNNVDIIYSHHTKIIKYFIEQLQKYNLNHKVALFKNYSNYNESLMSCIPIIFENVMDINIFINIGIEAKKYYFPLNSSSENSINIFNKIICLPLNLDINEEIIDIYISTIKNNLQNKVCLFAPCYNETNIIEWMDYHFKCGFELIVIYDDQSTIPVKNVISSYGKFNENKYIILENIVPQYFSGEQNNCKYTNGCVRSIPFFQEIKQYMKDCTHCLSIDIDEYLYLGQFNNIQELINHYEPFDQLYMYWKTFKSLVKYSTPTLIENFTYSNSSVEYIGKCLIKLSKTKGQTSPHVFDFPENAIVYPNDNYNYIYKDIFNTYFTGYFQNKGLPSAKEYMETFFENCKQNNNVPYIAHYKNQSIETFLKRRFIDRLLLIKKNESHCFSLCQIFYTGKHMYEKLINNTCSLINNPNISEYIEYIYNKKDDLDNDKLNLHSDGTVALETIDDVSKAYWSTHPNCKDAILTLDVYNYYNK
jgi:dTDP-4-amino-4,6-dideoxygalactose transaminase